MNNSKDPVLTSVYLFLLAWFGLGLEGAIKVSLIVAFVLLILISVPLIAYKGWIGCRVATFETYQLYHRYLINREVIRLRLIRLGLLRQRREVRMLELESINPEGDGDDPNLPRDRMADTPRVSDHGSVCDRGCDLHGALSALETHPPDGVADEAAPEGEVASSC